MTALHRHFLVVLLATWLPIGVVATAEPAKEKQPCLDRHGDPLPDGAIYRLGSTRFRAGWGVYFLAFSKDGKTLVSVNSMGRSRQDVVRIWKVDTGEQLRRFPLELTYNDSQGVALSPDGSLLAVLPEARDTLREGPIVLMDVATGRVARRFANQKHGCGMAFSPDGKMYAAVKESEPIRLWETATGKERLRLSGYRGWMDHLAFSPDGSKLVSVSSDRNALVWQIFGPALGRRPNDLTEPQLQNLWADLACEDGQVAFRAVRTLTAAAPGPVVNFLRRQEKDILRLDHRRVVRWIEELDSDEFAVREKATAELEKRGVLVEDSLRMALRNRPTLEMRKRLEILLSKLADKPIAPTILRGWYAIEVLEHLPTPASRKLLEEWAKNIPQAKAAVQRSIHPLKP